MPFRSILAAVALAVLPAAAQGDAWAEGARMPAARSEMRSAVIDSLIYVAGGFGGTDHLSAYNPVTDRWKSLRKLPAGLDHPMVEAWGGKLYVMKGGTWEYSPGDDSWAVKKSGKHQRSDGTAVAFGSHIYVFGGQGVHPIERYSPASDAWEEIGSMATVRGHVQAVVLGSAIWIIGGRAGNTMHRSVDIYDPANNKWSAGPSLNDLHTGHAAAVLGGRIFVAGGEVQADGGPAIVKSVEMHDPSAGGGWVKLKDMPTPLHGAASSAFGGRMYVLGGSTQAYAAVNSDRTFIYTPPAGNSPVIRPLPRRRRAQPAARAAGPGIWVWEIAGEGGMVDAAGRSSEPAAFPGR